LMYLVLLFVWAGVVHLISTMLGAASQGFGGTLRAVSYAATAGVASILPFVGGFIGLIWFLILTMIGLTIIHRTEGWKAVLATMAPLLLCCVCCGGLVSFVLFVAGRAIQ